LSILVLKLIDKGGECCKEIKSLLVLTIEYVN